jgi:hypothetical protein
MTLDLHHRELHDHLMPGPESREAAYLAWRDLKVRSALRQSLEHPEKMVPHAKVRELFGL